MTMYCTLADVRAELKAVSTTEDNALLTYIEQVSRRIDLEMGSEFAPFFAPYTEARQYLVTPDRVNSLFNTFLFVDPLLTLTAVSLGATALTLSTQVEAQALKPGHPYQRLWLKSKALTWYDCNCGASWPYEPLYVTITGVWGHHPRYANAYTSVDTITTVGGINASVTSFTVVDVDGARPNGITPRLSAGNVILVDDELMHVSATNTTTNTVTVQRGVNGTAAAAHAQGTAVEVYSVDTTIQRVTARQAALLYARRGAFEVTSITDVGVTSYPQDLLTEMRAALQQFAYA